MNALIGIAAGAAGATVAFAFVSLSRAFEDEATGPVSVVPEKIGDGLPAPFDRSFRDTPSGFYRVTLDGENTNGEDLNCIAMISPNSRAGLSCNWAPKKP